MEERGKMGQRIWEWPIGAMNGEEKDGTQRAQWEPLAMKRATLPGQQEE
jgi:hypothetical protein